MRSRTYAYLDTANWIDLAEGKVDDAQLLSALEERRIIPVISHNHVIELAQQPHAQQSMTVARYIQGVRRYAVWILNIFETITREVTQEARRVVLGTSQPACPFVFRPSLAFGQRLSPKDEAQIDGMTIAEMVDATRNKVPMGSYTQERRMQPLRRKIVREQRRRKGRLRIQADEHDRWILDYLPQDELRDLEARIAPGRSRSWLLGQFRIEHCPALSIDIAYQNGRNVATDEPLPSDMEDNSHLVGVAYCPVSFADRATYAALMQGKSNRSPLKNGEFEGWVSSLRQEAT